MGALGSGEIVMGKRGKRLIINTHCVPLIRLPVSGPILICFHSSKLVEVKYAMPGEENIIKMKIQKKKEREKGTHWKYMIRHKMPPSQTSLFPGFLATKVNGNNEETPNIIKEGIFASFFTTPVSRKAYKKL